jgi:hypothetical protein
MQPKLSHRESKRRRRLVRVVICGALGLGLGQLCPHLPVKLQPACHWAAKLVGLLGGS